MFFSYGQLRRVCTDNPVVLTARAKVKDNPVEVLTPAQLRHLLDCADVMLKPSIAIGAFAGLRPAEIDRLDWREVHLDRGFIEVTAAKSKTATHRLVAILPNLKAWLEPVAKRTGSVSPPNARKLTGAARINAGLEDWPFNALRHSFASYHLAKFQDAPALALQMGHTTTTMLFAHYREVVTPESSETYWQIISRNATVNN